MWARGMTRAELEDTLRSWTHSIRLLDEPDRIVLVVLQSRTRARTPYIAVWRRDDL